VYKTTARIGTRSTTDAVRYEQITGKLLSKAGHVQKALETLTRLTNWLNETPGATSTNVQGAKTVLQDTIKALDRE